MKIPSATEELSGEQGGQRVQAWRWLALIVVSLALFLDTVDVSIVNVALPNLQRDLHLSTADLSWVQGAYLLTYAGLMLLGGRAADLLGRRRIFLMGATLFGLASLTGGLAHSGWLLILARGVQGIGAALTMPSATSILTTTFAEGSERNKALGIFSATGGAGFTCGLVLGGVLTDYISWHWVFFINIPIVLLILLLARIVLHEGRSQVSEHSYDIAGAITVTGGLLLLVYTITQANQPGSTTLKTPGLLVLALVILACFIFIERYSKAPLMPLHIFRASTLASSSAVAFMLLGSFFSSLLICTLYLQDVLHYSPVMTSLALLPSSIVTIPVSRFVAPWCMNRLGLRWSLVVGLLCLLAGVTLFLRIGPSADYIGIILPATMLPQIGMSICVPTLAIAAVTGIKPSDQGLASGLQGTLAQAGGGLGLAITTAVIAANTATLPDVAARLNGFHAGLYVVIAIAVVGVLIALFDK